MTINEFINSGIKLPEHIIVYAHTENEYCKETHKMYDSDHPRCKDGMSDLVKNATLSSIHGSTWDPGALVLSFETEDIMYDYL
jgi:hypothetical protein